MKRVLVFTDKSGIPEGYKAAWATLVNQSGILMKDLVTTHIYGMVPEPLVKKGNESVARFNPEFYEEIKRAFYHKVSLVNPSLIVVCDPAVLAVLVEGNRNFATLDKCRGGVYNVRIPRAAAPIAAGVPAGEADGRVVVAPGSTASDSGTASTVPSGASEGSDADSGDSDDEPDTLETAPLAVVDSYSIPCVVTYPINAINQRVDFDIKDESTQVYKVKSGSWILTQDWRKIGRYWQGKQRRLPPFRYTVTRTLKEIEDARDWLVGCAATAIDIETYGSPSQISCIGFCGILPTGVVHSFVVPFGDKFAADGCFWSPDEHAIAIELVRAILDADSIKCFQNGSYDNSYLIRDTFGCSNYLLDSYHLWHAIYQELPKTLDFITSILLDEYTYWKDDIKGIDQKDETRRDPSMEKYWRYNAYDCYYTLWDCITLWQLVSKSPTLLANYTMEMRLNFMCMQMSLKGLHADKERREWHRERLTKLRDDSQTRLRYLVADPEFNPRSAPDRTFLLYRLLGCTPRDDRGRLIGPTSVKRPSSGSIPVKLARTEHPLFARILGALDSTVEPAVQISNICNMRLDTSRFRTHYGAGKTETWRLSSKASNFWDGGNAQNIRAEMRDWITADEGCFLMDVDYSQSDASFIAFESQDKAYMETMTCGRDTHAIHGEEFFGVSYDTIVKGKDAKDPFIIHPTRGVRNLTKRVVHGANFQMTGHTLFVTMGREAVVAASIVLGNKDAFTWTERKLIEFCSGLLSKFRTKYPRLSRKGWYGEIETLLVRDAAITNCWGYTRKFLGPSRDSGTQREATAHYGQSGTSGNINRTMDELLLGYITPRFRDAANPSAAALPIRLEPRHGIDLRLQTHDSLTFNINPKAADWREGCKNILTVMARPVIIHGHSVSVPTEAEIGVRWGKSLIKSNQMLFWDGVSEIDLNRVLSTR